MTKQQSNIIARPLCHPKNAVLKTTDPNTQKPNGVSYLMKRHSRKFFRRSIKMKRRKNFMNLRLLKINSLNNHLLKYVLNVLLPMASEIATCLSMVGAAMPLWKLFVPVITFASSHKPDCRNISKVFRPPSTTMEQIFCSYK